MPVSVSQSPEIWHRDDFPLIATWRNYKRVIEIGVDRAVYSECFLSRWVNGELYLGVDPYVKYDEFPWDREADFLTAVSKYARFSSVARLVRARSTEVAAAVREGLGKFYHTQPVDLVYVDGSHAYDAVIEDLRAWWPAVSERGMMAGHDWEDKVNHDNEGVQRAVLEFAEEIDRPVFVTGLDNPSSWYIYKTADPIPWKRT